MADRLRYSVKWKRNGDYGNTVYSNDFYAVDFSDAVRLAPIALQLKGEQDFEILGVVRDYTY